MIIIKRTTSDNIHFQELVKSLDQELRIRDGEEHSFYAQYNKTDHIKHVVVAYENEIPVGCGAIRAYDANTIEIKRMFVPLPHRRKGIASTLLIALENWCNELNYKKCILETGVNQPEAIAFYNRSRYHLITNYGPYKNIDNSVCFEKDLTLEGLSPRK